jgi:ubiquinol-cytochrome c reductase cytochrome c1 subunit
MKAIKKLCLTLSLLVISASVFAAAAKVDLVFDMPKIDLHDQASLQRGAKYFMNYCSGCHGMEYMRYSQMAEGIGMTDADGNVAEAIVMANLVFSGNRIGDPIKAAMTREQSKEYFGINVPDLTLGAKVRKPEWIYNYLLSFYPDETRQWGTNNAVFVDVAMPNVLSDLQGLQVPVTRVVAYDDDNRPIEEIIGFELVRAGDMTPQEFQQAMYDITNFMVFASDPKKLKRQRIGAITILFLIVFTMFAYLLKREYWKKIK